MNIAVFVSGNGSNLQALIDAERMGNLADGRIILVVSDREDAFALKRAEKAGVEVLILKSTGFSEREDYDKKVSEILEDKNIDLIVLAGFMRILSDFFVDKYDGRIINIHPALLPLFKGAHGIRDAFEAGAKDTGATVHFVTRELDSGPIILQESIKIEESDTLESLEEKIHKIEHKLYPEAVKLFVEGKLKIEDNKVTILE